MTSLGKKALIYTGIFLQFFSALIIIAIFMLLSACSVKEISFLKGSGDAKQTSLSSVPIQVEVRLADYATTAAGMSVRILDENLNQYQGRSDDYGFFSIQTKRMPSEIWAWFAKAPDGSWLRVANPTVHKIENTDVLRAILILVPIQAGIVIPDNVPMLPPTEDEPAPQRQTLVGPRENNR